MSLPGPVANDGRPNRPNNVYEDPFARTPNSPRGGAPTVVQDRVTHERIYRYRLDRWDPPSELETLVVNSGVVRDTQWHRTGWLFNFNPSNKKLLAANALTLVLVQGLANRGNVAHGVRDAVNFGRDTGSSVVQEIKDLWSGRDRPSPTAPAAKPPPTAPDSIVINPPNGRVAEVEVDTASVRNLVNGIERLQRLGVQDLKLTVTGLASDDYRLDAALGLGYPNTPNRDVYAKDRADNFVTALRSEAAKRNVDLTGLDLTVKVQEQVLSQPQINVLRNAAAELGFSSMREALSSYNAEGMRPGVQREVFDRLIGSNRRTVADLKGDLPVPPAQTQETPAKAPGEPYGPWQLWPWLPFWKIPKGRRETTTTPYEETITLDRTQHRVMFRPGAVEQVADGNDGETKQALIPDSYFKTRKGYDLLRDNKILRVLSYDFEDSEGVMQQIVVSCVDFDPGADAKAAIDEGIDKIISLNFGDIGHDLRHIVLFPTDHAGRESTRDDRFERFGPGIDFQEAAATLGINYLQMGTVEIHFDPTDTAASLRRHMGLTYVMLHEGEHSNSLNSDANIMEEGNDRQGRSVLYFPPRDGNVAEILYDNLSNPTSLRSRLHRVRAAVRDGSDGSSLGRRIRTAFMDPRKVFDVVVVHTDAEGTVTPLYFPRRTKRDPELAMATERRPHWFPTEYSKEHAMELASEAVAGTLNSAPQLQRADLSPVTPVVANGVTAVRPGGPVRDWALRSAGATSPDGIKVEPALVVYLASYDGPLEGSPLHDLAMEARSTPLESDDVLLHVMVGAPTVSALTRPAQPVTPTSVRLPGQSGGRTLSFEL